MIGSGEHTSSETPFFSIGITTYDRVEMLIETLHSVLDQTFADFEIVIGNDNPRRKITAKSLGVKDPRIQVVNHEHNLGELGNMNALVKLSRGNYFTWLADDDLLAPRFFEAMHDALVEFGLPTCAFTSFTNGDRVLANPAHSPGEARVYSGSEFLRLYWSQAISAIGTMGAFDREYLVRTGGLEDLSGGKIALHTEYLHLVKMGLLEKIVYVNQPLVVYRVHEGSWGCSNTNFEEYKRSGANLARRSVEYLRAPELIKDFDQNLTQMLRWLMGEFVAVARRTPGFHVYHLIGYFLWSRIYISSLKGSPLYGRAARCLFRAEAWLFWVLCKQKFLELAPAPFIKLAYSVRSLFQRRKGSSVSQVNV
jgi:glycosyltransferase involved in cell wall biosynthesis